MKDTIRKYKQSLIDNILLLDEEQIKKLSLAIANIFKSNNKIFVIGNGGSAATATHFVCDLTKIVVEHTIRGIHAISLTDNNSVITAIANDIKYEEIFLYQLKKQFDDGDMLIVISASGDSENIVNAVEYINSRKCITWGLVGFSGGKVKALSDEVIHIPCDNYGSVEDIHLMTLHIVSQNIKNYL